MYKNVDDQSKGKNRAPSGVTASGTPAQATAPAPSGNGSKSGVAIKDASNAGS